RVYRRRTTNSILNPFPTLPQVGKWEVKTLPLPITHATKPFSFADLHQQRLLDRHAPPSVLVNEENDIVHISDHPGRYLPFADGDPSRNLLKVVHPTLRLDLRATLFAARQQSSAQESPYVRTKTDGESPLISIIVEPITEPETANGF